MAAKALSRGASRRDSLNSVRSTSSGSFRHDPYASFYQGELSSDDEEEEKPLPLLYVRGKNATNVESLMKLFKKRKIIKGAKLVYDKNQGGSFSQFDHNKYFHRLQTYELGNTLLTAHDCDSTQTLLKQNFDLVPVGTVLVADNQGAGRGRGGNQWESPKGCLMFSFTTQISNGTTLPFLQYVVALSIVQAIQSEAAHCMACPWTDSLTSADVVDVRIKWPNDVYGPQAMKIGGVLCESDYSMETKTFNVTIGCGINVKNSTPTTCLNDIFMERQKELMNCSSTQRPSSNKLVPPSREDILGAVLTRIEANFKSFKSQGFDPLKATYLRHWLHNQQTVTLIETDKDGVRRLVCLVIKGLTTSGYLLATDKNNTPFELHPDGNSLDFFNGLVRKKL